MREERLVAGGVFPSKLAVVKGACFMSRSRQSSRPSSGATPISPSRSDEDLLKEAKELTNRIAQHMPSANGDGS